MPRLSNFETFVAKLRKVERRTKVFDFFMPRPSNFETFVAKLRKRSSICNGNNRFFPYDDGFNVRKAASNSRINSRFSVEGE